MLDHMNLTDIYRSFYPKATEYMFLSSAHGTFFWIDYMLDDRTSLNKFNKIEIISSIFSDHVGMKLEISNKRKTGKFISMWRLNNMLLNNQWVKDEINREIKNHLETNKNGNMTYQNLWDAAKAQFQERSLY